jgi:hypothetical protein
MVWYNPLTWYSETTPSTPAVSTLPGPTESPIGARRRTRHGRKGSKRYNSKRYRTGKKSNRS